MVLAFGTSLKPLCSSSRLRWAAALREWPWPTGGESGTVSVARTIKPYSLLLRPQTTPLVRDARVIEAFHTFFPALKHLLLSMQHFLLVAL